MVLRYDTNKIKPIIQQSDDVEQEDVAEREDKIKEHTEYIISCLPEVLQKLENNGKLEEFLDIFSAIKSEMPLDNISFILFLETAKWYANKRFSEISKQWWRISYKLFKGKFLSCTAFLGVWPENLFPLQELIPPI